MLNQYNWQVIGASQRGASHIRAGSVCQDAIHWLPEHGLGPPLILSVADGHGSSRFFRSGIGARFAVDAAGAAFTELLASIENGSLIGINQIKKHLDGEMPRNIVKNWLGSVDAHTQIAPFIPSEFSASHKMGGETSSESSQNDKKIPAYGSTIISVLVHEQFIVYTQLGDGDIISISEQGKAKSIFATRQLGTETNSLSEAKLVRISSSGTSPRKNEDEFGTVRPDQNFHVHFQIIDASLPPPAMIMLSTDGLSNSYKDDADFQQFSIDIYQTFVTKPYQVAYREVGELLPVWLDKITRDGSRDDVTVGILCRKRELE